MLFKAFLKVLFSQFSFVIDISSEIRLGFSIYLLNIPVSALQFSLAKLGYLKLFLSMVLNIKIFRHSVESYAENQTRYQNNNN